jgi:hypothetical protein
MAATLLLDIPAIILILILILPPARAANAPA